MWTSFTHLLFGVVCGPASPPTLDLNDVPKRCGNAMPRLPWHAEQVSHKGVTEDIQRPLTTLLHKYRNKHISLSPSTSDWQNTKDQSNKHKCNHNWG